MVKTLLKFLRVKINRAALQCSDYPKGTFNSGP